MYDSQIGMAVRRNILLSFPANTTYERISKNYAMASYEVSGCYNKIKLLRSAAKHVHPSVLQYSDALSRLLAGRINFLYRLRTKAAEISNGQATAADFEVISRDYAAFDRDELAKVNFAEAMMTKRLGEEYSISPPERALAYSAEQKRHEQKVQQALANASAKDIYAPLVGMKIDGWTFEESEYRDGRMGAPAVEASGRIVVPYAVSVVGRNSGASHVFRLTLYFSVTPGGKLILVGLLA